MGNRPRWARPDDETMDDGFDNRSDAEAGSATPHLTPEHVTAYLDGDLVAAERARLDEHLRVCAACRQDVAEVRSTMLLLRGLPEYRPRRSFQLSPDRIAVARPWWERFGLRVLPALPALRMATVAAAVLLVAVSAGELIQDRTGNESRNEQPAIMAEATTAPTTQALEGFAPTATSGALLTQAPPPAEATQAAKEPTESVQANAVRQEQEPTEEPPRAAVVLAARPTVRRPSPRTTSWATRNRPAETPPPPRKPRTKMRANSAAGAAAPADEATEDVEASVGDEDDTESIAMVAIDEGTTTADATTTADDGRNAGDGESADSFAAEEATQPPPTPTRTPTAIPASPTALPATPSRPPSSRRRRRVRHRRSSTSSGRRAMTTASPGGGSPRSGCSCCCSGLSSPSSGCNGCGLAANLKRYGNSFRPGDVCWSRNARDRTRSVLGKDDRPASARSRQRRQRRRNE